MAGYFKKRRKSQGANKNEEKVQRAEQARSRESSGATLQAKYPSVRSLALTLRFLTPQQQLLEEKVLRLEAGDACRLDASCPGRCGVGRFDFGEAVSRAVGQQQKSAGGGVVCREPLYAGSRETCGCQTQYKMEVDYLPSLDAPSAAA